MKGSLQDGNNRTNISAVLLACLSFIIIIILADTGLASSAREINTSVDVAIERWQKEVVGTDGLIKKSKAILVFPRVFKAGFFIGGEYGEGAMRINGKTVDYYNTVAASIGFQLGAQTKTIILVFMEQGALDKFRNSEGWEAGVDGSVAIITVGAGDTIDTSNIQDPILAFVFGQKGLMYNLTLEGSKFTKIHPDK